MPTRLRHCYDDETPGELEAPHLDYMGTLHRDGSLFGYCCSQQWERAYLSFLLPLTDKDQNFIPRAVFNKFILLAHPDIETTVTSSKRGLTDSDEDTPH